MYKYNIKVQAIKNNPQEIKFGELKHNQSFVNLKGELSIKKICDSIHFFIVESYRNEKSPNVYTYSPDTLVKLESFNVYKLSDLGLGAVFEYRKYLYIKISNNNPSSDFNVKALFLDNRTIKNFVEDVDVNLCNYSFSLV